ncbi:DUF3703 domain-containing protein [Cupriavidus basilensis]|uniref:DUF3703 domain-containing protein n=1 Tax=Cupriavidus basilensis TaxID=68895 RepID=UPI0023E826D3|nr:DUF3703 domain-containing protein [Cupriavidus basilensis]MDF3889216.1 DUF3703 domain-containing protein [Cupriavidus basilensis]
MYRSTFAIQIRPHVQAELDAAAAHEARGEPILAFTHLERAHILGQESTVEHVRTHCAMFRWALRQNIASEAFGQTWRILAAVLKTWLGWLPIGNTGGAKVSGFKPMPVPADLQQLIDAARSVH